MLGTPTLIQIIRAQQDGLALRLRFCLPGIVTAYRAGPPASADVNLAVKRRHGSSTVADPALNDVPVLFPGTRRFALDFGLTAGDQVLVLHGDRSLDEWVAGSLEGAGAQDPRVAEPWDPRVHDLTDAVCLPFAVGGLPDPLPIPGPSPGAPGRYRVSFLALVDDLLVQLTRATVATGAAGLQPLDPATQQALANLRARIASVR